MAKTYAIVVGVVLLLVGVLGWVFRGPFGEIPVWHLIVNIVAGIWGLFVGFMGESKPQGQGMPRM